MPRLLTALAFSFALTALAAPAWAEPPRRHGGYVHRPQEGIRFYSPPPARTPEYERAPMVPPLDPNGWRAQQQRAQGDALRRGGNWHDRRSAASPGRSAQQVCRRVYRQEYDPFGPDRRYAQTECRNGGGRYYLLPGSTVRVR